MGILRTLNSFTGINVLRGTAVAHGARVTTGGGQNLLPANGSTVVPETLPAESVLGSYDDDAITLGRYVDGWGVGERIRYGGDQHVLVFGPNGKGKGTRILMPNLLQMRGNRSIVVVDPKGELAAVTAPFRRSLGRVVILNPFGVLTDIPDYADLQSCGFNPLAQLDPASSTFNRDAAQLADAMVAVESKDPHWGMSARALVAAILMYVAIEAKQRGTVPSLARVRELICLPSSAGIPEKNIPPVGIPALAQHMMTLGYPGLSNKASQFTDWNREIQSIVSTAKIQTEPFDDVEIATDTAQNGFDFKSIKRTPTTVYLILPPEAMERHSKWLRMVLTCAIQSVLRVRRPGEPRVLFMLDEFYALGHLEIISTVWALVRGYGIAMMPVLQDMGQLKKLYGDMWETFIGMAGAVVSFAPNDLTTAEWLSKRAGEGERAIETTSISDSTSGGSGYSSGGPHGSASSNSGWSASSSTNRSSIRAPLASPHKFFGMKAGFVTITLDGLSDMIPAYTPPYYNIRQCWLVARDNPYYLG